MPSKIEHSITDGNELKRCSRCTEWKPLDEYTKSKPTSDGLCDKCKPCLKKYRHERIDKDKEYRKNNREKVNLWRRNKYKNSKERQTDVFIQRRIKENLARRLRFVLKGVQKSERTCELIGCSPEELKKHIECTFSERMSWENYGEWHIDHVIPCAAFDQTIEVQRKACWNFRNLRALWGPENLKKSSLFNKEEKEKFMDTMRKK